MDVPETMLPATNTTTGEYHEEVLVLVEFAMYLLLTARFASLV